MIQDKREKVLNSNETTDMKSMYVPFPVTDPILTSKIFDFLQLNHPLKNIKKGINEVIKQMSKDNVEIVIMAANANPPELLASIPTMCEEKSISYCFVPDAAGLGRACGIKRPIICCCVLSSVEDNMKEQTQILKDKIEMLFY